MAVRTSLTPDRVKCILSYLFRRFRITEHPVQHPKERSAVPVVQLAQGCGIRASDSFEKQFIFFSGLDSGYDISL